MKNNPFQFRHFAISQAHTPAKVGTDGILLGAWVNCEKDEKILDIGTGTGLIAMMIAQRNPQARVVALEPHPGAAQDARQNFDRSQFAQRLQLVPVGLAAFEPASRFDLIVSNPPFFDSGAASPDADRAAWRHQESLTVSDILQFAANWLAAEGKLALILPSWMEAELREEAAMHQLFAHRITHVQPTPKKIIKRILVEFQRQKAEPKTTRLVVQTGGSNEYSTEFIALTRDFYPWMD